MPDVMTGANQSKRIGGKFVPDYLSTADWSGHMLAHCLDNIDMLSEHYYSSSDMHTDLKLEKKVNIGPQPLIEWERAPATQVRVKYEHYQEYLKRIPALRAKPVPIAIDEWAYMGGGPNSYKVVPAYAWAFHEMFRHSDLFQLGAFTFATAMMSQTRTDATLNPTGLLFKMYRDHFGTIPVEVSGNSPQPKPIFPAGGDQPAVNPGSDTYPLDVVSAWSEDRKTLTIAVLNPSDGEHSMQLKIAGATIAGPGRLWQMAPKTVDAVVAIGQKPGVTVEESSLDSLPETIVAPPFSVSIYSFPAK
jgi:alpha-N-arabinofuranosidase